MPTLSPTDKNSKQTYWVLTDTILTLAVEIVLILLCTDIRYWHAISISTFYLLLSVAPHHFLMPMLLEMSPINQILLLKIVFVIFLLVTYIF